MARLKRWSIPGLLAVSAFLFLLLLFFLSIISIPTRPVCAGTVPVETYDQLLSAIRQTRADSQARIESAAEQEKVR